MAEMQKKNETIGWTNDYTSKSTKFFAHEKAINTKHWNPPNNSEAQIRQNEQVENAKNVPIILWQDKIKISDHYKNHCAEFISRFSDFEFTWDGHLGRVRAVQHLIEILPENLLSVLYVRYRTGPIADSFENYEFVNRLGLKVIEPARTEWASPIFLTPKKDHAPILW